MNRVDRSLRLPLSAALAVAVLGGAHRSPAQNCDHFWQEGFASGNLSEIPYAMAAFDDGDGPALFIGGHFNEAGGVAANYIVRYEGGRFEPLGAGVSQGPQGVYVFAATGFDEGSGPALYVGGRFGHAGKVNALNIARWDGAEWSAVGGGLASQVDCLEVFDDGSGPALYAGGSFAGGVARWDGTSWQVLGGGIDSEVYVKDLAVFDDGSGPALYASGLFTMAEGQDVHNIARWNGQHWTGVGGGMSGWVFSMAVFDDGKGPALYAGGSFASAGGNDAAGVARWDGQAWSPLGAGLSGGFAIALCVADLGAGPRLFVGGTFSSAGDKPAASIASWNGKAWAKLGTGLSGGNTFVQVLAPFDAGHGTSLMVGGLFYKAGNVAVFDLARWDGTSWSPAGNGADATVTSLASLPDANGPAVYAGGEFQHVGDVAAAHVARWQAGEWSSVGGGMDADVLALAVFDDGQGEDLYAAGSFMSAGDQSASHIARWDGQAWSDVGGGTDGEIMALAVYDDGAGPALYAGGAFTHAGGIGAVRIARWDGAAWSPLSGSINDVVRALAVHDPGDGARLYAGGDFSVAGGVSASRIAEWNGQYWKPLGKGITGKSVHALASFMHFGQPRLYAGGDFSGAGGQPAGYIADWDGAAWAEVGGGIVQNGNYPTVECLLPADLGDGLRLYVGGYFVQTGGGPASCIVSWDDQGWHPLSTGLDARVRAVAASDSGDASLLYAGGDFKTTYLVSTGRIAAWGGCSGEPCYADCDQSSQLDLFDFLCFTNAFNGGGGYSDCDGSGAADIFDFLCFLNEFNAGCG